MEGGQEKLKIQPGITLPLDHEEIVLFEFLNEVNSLIKRSLKSGFTWKDIFGSGICYCIAGGWVRDKLLYLPSKDYDLISTYALEFFEMILLISKGEVDTTFQSIEVIDSKK